MSRSQAPGRSLMVDRTVVQFSGAATRLRVTWTGRAHGTWRPLLLAASVTAWAALTITAARPAESGPRAAKAASLARLEPPSLEIIAQVGAQPSGVAVEGDRAYLSTGSQLVVIDLAGALGPAVVGRSEVGRRQLVDLAAQDGTVFAIDADQGLRAFDVTSPARPRSIGYLGIDARGRALAVAGPLAFVVSQSELHVVDIRQPERMRQLGRMRAQMLISDVAVLRDRVAVLGNGALLAVDVGDPAEPVIAAQLDWEEGGCQALTARGDHLYLGCSGWGISPASPLLRIVSATDPEQLIEIARLPAHGFSTRDVALAGDHLLLVDDTALRVIDVSEPARPRPIGRRAPLEPGTGRLAAGVDAEASRALVVHDQGLAALRIDAAGAVTQTRGIHAPAWDDIVDLETDGTHLYAVDWGQGLRIADLSDPAAPLEHAISDDPYASAFELVPPSAETNGRRLGYLLGRSGFRVFDLSDLAQPELLGSVEEGSRSNYKSLAVHGGLAYAVVEDTTFAVIDVSEPTRPRLVARVEDGSCAYPTLVWSNEHLYSHCAFRDRVDIYDLRDPTAPRRVGAFNINGQNILRMTSWREHLYMPQSGGNRFNPKPGLLIYDATEPVNPRPGATLLSDGDGLAVWDDVAYLTTGGSQLWPVAVDVPARPRQGRPVPVPSSSYSIYSYVAAAGDRVAVGDIGSMGVNVFRAIAPELFDAYLPLVSGSSAR